MPVYNLCRICLTEDTHNKSMQPLFDTKNARCAEIVQQIQECGGIELKQHEEFPKMICVPCLEALKTSFKFRTMCQTSENTLLDAVVKSELKIEPLEASPTPTHDDSSRSHGEKDFFLEFIDPEEVLSDIGDNEKQNFSCPLGLKGDSSPEYLYPTESECDIESEASSEAEVSAKQSRRATKTNQRGRGRRSTTRMIVKKLLPKQGRGRRKKVDEAPSSIMCEICGNIYSKQSVLNMHMRRHMAEKPFECEICSKTFACPSAISRHMRIHTGEKPYICKFCGRTFTDRSTNIKHERIHTNERPFTCQTCGKSFTYSNVLKNHMLTHTGEKPFPCLACNKTFSRKHQLDQHCATITHQQTIKSFSLIATEGVHFADGLVALDE